MADPKIWQTPDIDAAGNINVHAEAGVELVLLALDDAGEPIDISAEQLVIVYAGRETPLEAGEAPTERVIRLTQAAVRDLPRKPASTAFVVVDRASDPSPLYWEGRIVVRDLAAC
jgi:hypothetical protein